jgi:hypothetical protein
MTQRKKSQPLEDQVLSRMLAMPPDPKIAAPKKKSKKTEKKR